MDDKDQVQKRKWENLPHEANAPNHEESDYDGNLLVSSGKMGDGVEETQADKTEQIKVYRRSRFKRDLTKGRNIYSSASYDVHGLTENNIELQDEPGIHKKLQNENISGSSEQVKRELKEDDFGSAQVEETQADKTEQIKVYRRSRFKRDLTKGRNIYSSASYDVHGLTENNIELQDEPGIHKKLIGENISGSSEQVKRELKEDDFGSAQQEEIARKESAGTIVPQDDVCPIFPPQYEQVQDISERPELPMTMEAWSEEELDALWIGVRRYGPGNWLAMLKDPMSKILELRTSDALSERWKIERERIIYLENFQVMVSAGANLQEARPGGTVKIHTPQTSLVQSPDGTEVNEFHSECISSDPAFSVFPSDSENPIDATSRAKENQLHGLCDAGTDKVGTTDDFSDTESELSLKDWHVEKEVSSEGTISD
ncbi:uncharacterized protein LOC127811623 isoform X2 [Diospyros lotus]|uniref:uncharacterized protein LOC127811623 isoform X2 n=1 Tax=Diospyros lotus TaxID=55363 RepID=UPI0022592330|nr:uncharacterized protein LOC127811623 isoform X2 [Diospyros lotus]